MAKINKPEIYTPDTNLSRGDNWVGSDETTGLTKTYYLGYIMDFIAENLGVDGEQNNTIVEKALGVIDISVTDAFIDTINGLNSYVVAPSEVVVFTGEFSQPSNSLNTKFVYLLKTGKGDYGSGSTQLTIDDLLLVNPVQEETTRNSEIISNFTSDDKIFYGKIIKTDDELVFEYTPFLFVIAGVTYFTGLKFPVEPFLITLDAPDESETNSRIDLIVVDSRTEGIVVIKGEPSANPQEPTLDYGYQLRVTSIYVSEIAETTVIVDTGDTPTGIVTTAIYDENTGSPNEWDVDSTTVGVVVDDTTNPKKGSVSIKIPTTMLGGAESVSFTTADTILNVLEGNLIFQLQSDERWFIDARLEIGVEDESTSKIGRISLSASSISRYGYNSNSDEWQTVIIPIADLDETINDAQNIYFESYFAPEILIDDIKHQTIANTTTVIEISDTHEGYFEKGIRDEFDVKVIIGDYDDSGNGTKIEVDDATGRVTTYGGFVINALSKTFGAVFDAQYLTEERRFNLPDNGNTPTIPVSVNGFYADASGNIPLAALTNPLTDNVNVNGFGFISGNLADANGGVWIRKDSYNNDTVINSLNGLSTKKLFRIINEDDARTLPLTNYAIFNGNDLTGRSDYWLPNIPFPTTLDKKYFAFSVNGNYADINGNIIIDSNSELLLKSSTITTSRNSLATDADGYNDCISATDVTITIVDNATMPVEIGTAIPYKRSNTGNIIITAGAGVTAPTYQTYTLDDVITYVKTGIDTWECLNPPVDTTAIDANTDKISYITPTTETGVALDLSNAVGKYYNMASANAGETYTFSGEVVGGWAISLINTTNEPVVTDATKIAGATWVTGTDMNLVVRHNGTTTQYFFLEI